MHYRADVTSRAKAQTNLAFPVILDVLKATVRFFIFTRAAQLASPHLMLLRLAYGSCMLWYFCRILSAHVLVCTAEPIHLFFNFVLEHLQLICVDELGKRIYLFLVEKRHEIVTKTPHFTVPVQNQLVFKAGQTCNF